MVRTIMIMLGLWLIGANGLQVESEISPNYEIQPEEYEQLMQLQTLGYSFAKHFQNITLKDLKLPSLPNPQDLQCLADMSLLMQGVSAGSLWSLRMFDAWGKIPSGILYLNLLHLGNYDECVKINKQISDKYSLRGKYCLAKLPLAKVKDVGLSLNSAVCLPASCTTEHMNAFISQLLQKLIGSKVEGELVITESCKTSDREPLDALTVFTIVLLSLFAGLALLATLWDYFMCRDQTQLPQLVRIFSIRANSRALFRVTESKSNPNVIDCLHGMRCLSLIWVVFGHDFNYGAALPNINNIAVFSWFETPFSAMIKEAVFAVDTFFFLSGLLVIMIALRSMERSKGRLNVPLMYLHRILRLTPLLAVTILVYMTLMRLLADGPLMYKAFNYGCHDNWYLTLLYVQNYATKEMCLPHSWYLAVDMQLYIISPILLFALYKWGKKAAIVIGIIIVLLTVWLFTIMMVHKYSMFSKNSLKNLDSQFKIYYPTHQHATPWLIGALFGYFLHTVRGKSFKLNCLKVWTGWLICLCIMFATIFALYPYFAWRGPQLSVLGDSLYFSLTRIGWPLALCWVVFACMQGYGGLANSFLSSPLWQPLSKLSYCVYLFHFLIEELHVRRVKTNAYFSNYDVMLRFWSDFGITVLLAYAVYVTIETPLGGLENLILPNRRPSPKTVKATPADAEPSPEFNRDLTPATMETATEAPEPTKTPS